MELFLHPNSEASLDALYKKAFLEATKLYVLTAYLTRWDSKLALNPNCTEFRLIIGEDFGITKKAACRDVLAWLPPAHKGKFLVAHEVQGFHPKALFWQTENGDCFAVVGSSNLTRAAFETNYEANAYRRITKQQFHAAVSWVEEVQRACVDVDENWLRNYVEAKRTPPTPSAPRPRQTIADFELPPPQADFGPRLVERRTQMQIFDEQKPALLSLIQKCADGKISSEAFYTRLSNHWSHQTGNRFQGAGWERQGKSANFTTICQSLLNILNAPRHLKDDVVAEELNRLAKKKVPARRSFFTEMLSQFYPDLFPLIDKPIRTFLSRAGYRQPRGYGEGEVYVHLSRKFRSALVATPNYPANDLAELDAVIQHVYK